MERKKIFFVFLIIFLSYYLFSCRVRIKEEDIPGRAKAIHSRILTVDSHCDTPMQLLRKDWNINDHHQSDERASGKVDLPRMKEGGLDAEFFAVYIGQGERAPDGYARAKKRAFEVLEAIHKMCASYPDIIGLATTPDEGYRLKKAGKLIAFIGMENGYPIGKDLSLLGEYYKRGVRYLTLCHSQDNDICDSSTDRRNPEDQGLSEFGKEVVLECNRLGIMVDVSHASDKSFFDVLKVSRAPIIASHSSCRAIASSPRNLSDEMIRALARNGGVIQICFLSSYIKTLKPNPEREKALKELESKYGPLREIRDEALRQKALEEYRALSEKFPEERATLRDLVDHIDHVVKLVGVDYVGIGTDFDGGGGVVGCDDASEMYHVTEELLRRGYSEKDIEKIWGGNLMRVFRKVMEVSRLYPSKLTENKEDYKN